MSSKVSPDVKELVRKLRAREQWLRYDSIVIGPGASAVHQSWFENFATFANAKTLQWGGGQRSRAVGDAYSNHEGEREDFAQIIYQTGVEFIAPIGALGFESSLVDAGLLPQLFVADLPQRMSFQVQLQGVDNVLLVPGSHLPGGTGNTNMQAGGFGAVNTYAGSNGAVNLRSTWTWPTPLPIPAKSKLAVFGQIDNPISEFLQELVASPGTKTVTVPDGNGETKNVEMPNWYAIRVWHRGPRSVQLRGAYSQGAGTDQ